MANATADKKKAAAKKGETPKDDAATASPQPASRQRVSARVNITQAKTIEGQFDTASKKVSDLGDKLAEIEARFDDRPDHQFAVAAREAREELSAAQERMVTAKEKFEGIRSTLEDFFG